MRYRNSSGLRTELPQDPPGDREVVESCVAQSVACEAFNASNPRLHIVWDGHAARVWLGIDRMSLGQEAELVRTVMRALQLHGMHLSALICNGRTLHEADALHRSTPTFHQQEI